jgi:hypothetical protein
LPKQKKLSQVTLKILFDFLEIFLSQQSAGETDLKKFLPNFKKKETYLTLILYEQVLAVLRQASTSQFLWR